LKATEHVKINSATWKQTYTIYLENFNIRYISFQVATWSSHTAKVKSLLLFGENILSLDVKGNIFLWAFKDIKNNLVPVGHIVLDQDFTPTCIMHPDTYLNKVNTFFSMSNIHK